MKLINVKYDVSNKVSLRTFEIICGNVFDKLRSRIWGELDGAHNQVQEITFRDLYEPTNS